MSIKPMLFNTDMVRALLENRKTVTRRVVKPQPTGDIHHVADGTVRGYWVDGNCQPYRPPYQPVDILYVREAWCWCPCWDCGHDSVDGCVDEIANKFYNEEKKEWGCYGYKASFEDGEEPFERWYPSIHMPKEAARIFLRVTDVRTERLQDITSADVKAEGTEGRFGATRGAFEMLWDSTIKPADYDKYGWLANPWVWVIEFERCEKPEGEGTP